MRVWRLSVCLSRTSGLTREQRGLGRPKLAQNPGCRAAECNPGQVVYTHMWLGHHFQGQKVKGQLAGAGAYCGGLPHSLLWLCSVFSKHILGCYDTIIILVWRRRWWFELVSVSVCVELNHAAGKHSLSHYSSYHSLRVARKYTVKAISWNTGTGATGRSS